MNEVSGLFITFEGPDGSGKTTLIRRLMDRLKNSTDKAIVYSREPGGEPIAEEIRQIILDPKNTDLDPRAEALLYAASRRQHLVRKIIPALERGDLVLCDRFVDSSIAYQGYGRELGAENVWKINQFAIEGQMPDLTIYCDISAEEGLARIQAHRPEKDRNRLDEETLAFHQRVVQGYRALLSACPDRIVAIDARQSPEDMEKEALQLLKQRFTDFFKESRDQQG